MKFGGSLLASKRGVTFASRIVAAHSKQKDIIVVVSALGNVSDLLLDTAAKAKTWDTTRIAHFVERLRGIHMEALDTIGLGSDAHDDAVGRLEGLLDDLKLTLSGVSILREVTPRSKDLILSFGERLSLVVVAAAMRHHNISFEPLTGGEAGIVTDGSFGEAEPNDAATRMAVRKTLLPLLATGVVPVVTGNIGRSPGGETTTLGRGGSDYTATLIAAAMGADEVWIWTDVDGIHTADPKVVKDSRIIEMLSYAEAEEMGFFGAENMHPLSLAPVRRAGIPIRIRNGFRPGNPGTLIQRRERKTSSIAKAVLLVDKVGILTVSGGSLVGRAGTAAKVFDLLGAVGANILMISQSVSESNISTIVRSGNLALAESALSSGLQRVGIRDGVLKIDQNVAVLAVIGAGMKGSPGFAAKVFSTVARQGVNVRMIAQGSSELNISFVVSRRDAVKAVNALHREVVLRE
jgi:aspartate kinase